MAGWAALHERAPLGTPFARWRLTPRVGDGALRAPGGKLVFINFWRHLVVVF